MLVEEFMNMLNTSADKLATLKSIKSISDIGFKRYDEFIEVLIKNLTNTEIIEVVKGNVLDKNIYEKVSQTKLNINMLSSLENTNIMDFIRENSEWLQNNDIKVYDITIKMKPEQQAEFVCNMNNSNILSLNEMREIVALMSPKAKGLVNIDKLPENCRDCYQLERYEVPVSNYRKYGKIKVDLTGDPSKYAGLDRLICLGGDELDLDRIKELIKICPNIEIVDEINQPSTAQEYLVAQDWLEKIISSIPKEYTVLQKIAMVDNIMGKEFCYSPELNTGNYVQKDTQSKWRVIASKKGVCAGLSNVEQEIFKRLGIDSEVIKSEDGEHAFLKINGIEITRADGSVEKGSTILDTTWNLAMHRFGGIPQNFLITYDEIRKHDITKERS